MKNFWVTWTGGDGAARVSSVAYDKESAEGRRAMLWGQGYGDAQVVESKPGVRPTAG
ncbi:hypothetical protein ACFQ0X_43875 [Streptomyces rectiviolaceus]|uniref:Uncharacterized protein n=1 Tax=Streptomyces rectiviolaceus TaxID=332591 RepID=A0ABP6NPM6_9ACTN